VNQVDVNNLNVVFVSFFSDNDQAISGDGTGRDIRLDSRVRKLEMTMSFLILNQARTFPHEHHCIKPGAIAWRRVGRLL
jgi:hypothetical protein